MIGQRGFPAAAAVLACLLGAGPALAADTVQPGSYCPLPKANEPPRCLDPARAEYEEFFSEVESGEIDDAGAARLERDVAAGAGADNPYLALSSLSYGYFRLAQQMAREEPDPTVVARLERWNALLAKAYLASEEDVAYQTAVETAALDIRDQAPAVRLQCMDDRGDAAECDSTEAVIRGINATSREVGIEGALSRLIRRILGDDS